MDERHLYIKLASEGLELEAKYHGEGKFNSGEVQDLINHFNSNIIGEWRSRRLENGVYKGTKVESLRLVKSCE